MEFAESGPQPPGQVLPGMWKHARVYIYLSESWNVFGLRFLIERVLHNIFYREATEKPTRQARNNEDLKGSGRVETKTNITQLLHKPIYGFNETLSNKPSS